MYLKVQSQQTPLSGTIRVPGDKSISHRAVLLAALATGTSTIRNWLPAGDTLATLGVIQALGVPVEIDKHSPQFWNLQIEGQGLHGLRPPAAALDCRNAGTGIRLLAGVMVGQSFPSVLDGSEQLRKRPMRRITEPLQSMGADIHSSGVPPADGRAPLSIQPAALHGVEHHMRVASAQVKSALLLAGLYATGETRVHQPGPARDHTERMLGAMGIDVVTEDGWVTLKEAPVGGWQLAPLDLTVPGDFSSAAFPLIAAAIVPHSSITIADVGLNETRTGLLDVLRDMGVQVAVNNVRLTGGEPIADLSVSFDELHSTTVGGETVVRAIDEFPVWAVVATQAAGASTVCDAAELRVKEVDRISVLAGELRRLGVLLDEAADGFTIHGPLRLQGAEMDSHDDHRLGMALAVAGLVANGQTWVMDAGCIADSFPGFVKTMRQLGAEMEWSEK
jgi:3-phosphoshikimate 1-carboxyvinyltransferase